MVMEMEVELGDDGVEEHKDMKLFQGLMVQADLKPPRQVRQVRVHREQPSASSLGNLDNSFFNA